MFRQLKEGALKHSHLNR